MNPLTRPRQPLYVTPPEQPEIEMLTREVGEVAKATEAGHCHHSTFCLSPLRVGDVVVRVGSFFALLDHVEADERDIEHIARLSGVGGVPKRL